MPPPPDVVPGDAAQLLHQLEWTVIRRLDGLLHGDYRTLFRGPGLDLADLREYQYQDDVRHIDWNVTARLQTPYVREYNEDRDLTAWFLLDLSASQTFGSQVQKLSVATAFVTVLSRLLTRHGNRVGALLYGNRVDTVLPPKSSRQHVLHLMHLLMNRPPPQAGATDLATLINEANRSMPRRGLVFVISDFITQPGWEAALGRLTQRHEVIAVRLYDPLEMELPDIGLMWMQDPETGEQLFVDTHDKGFRRRYAKLAAEREDALREGLAAAGVDTLELATDDDLAEAISRFADLRRSRSRLSGGAVSKPKSDVTAHLEART
ncbi:DUF58 domain-containing protein [Uliginosibacterium sp. H1]|uniref:DUF58 domain-containing protein n=1 Tax=Uliginosibacterium sp. H1 TaxID=3114757 RepID=UPI002E19513A|nr:DUF58 domain-containing protein [Uliginosibacterium sp. H1]